jgi:hypothetical protein
MCEFNSVRTGVNMGALAEASVMTRPLTTQAIFSPKLETCNLCALRVSVGVSVIGFRVFGLGLRVRRRDRGDTIAYYGARAALLRRLVSVIKEVTFPLVFHDPSPVHRVYRRVATCITRSCEKRAPLGENTMGKYMGKTWEDGKAPHTYTGGEEAGSRGTKRGCRNALRGAGGANSGRNRTGARRPSGSALVAEPSGKRVERSRSRPLAVASLLTRPCTRWLRICPELYMYHVCPTGHRIILYYRGLNDPPSDRNHGRMET